MFPKSQSDVNDHCFQGANKKTYSQAMYRTSLLTLNHFFFHLELPCLHNQRQNCFEVAVFLSSDKKSCELIKQ